MTNSYHEAEVSYGENVTHQIEKRKRLSTDRKGVNGCIPCVHATLSSKIRLSLTLNGQRQIRQVVVRSVGGCVKELYEGDLEPMALVVLTMDRQPDI